MSLCGALHREAKSQNQSPFAFAMAFDPKGLNPPDSPWQRPDAASFS
jgi:hypothetical protein